MIGVPISWLLLDAGLRGTLLALLLLLAALMLRERRAQPLAQAGAALALGLVVQVIGSAPWVEQQLPGRWQAPLVAVAVGNAVLFVAFVQALFDDDFRWRGLHAAAWAAAAALGALNCMLGTGPREGPALAALLLQRAVPVLSALLAIGLAARHWRVDLVEPRRRLRWFIVATGAAYSVWQLLARGAGPDGRLAPLDAGIDLAALLVIVGVLAWRLLGVGATELLPAATVPQAAPDAHAHAQPDEPPAAGPADAPAATPDPADQRLAQALHQAMAVDRLYRGENLTIAALAAHLDVPEYRLRRVINRHLGHRNFNAYVNAWRLDEARAALADPQRGERPVLSIALDAGFQSIGPFNRAFKAATGLTPTEFRQQKLAES